MCCVRISLEGVVKGSLVLMKSNDRYTMKSVLWSTGVRTRSPMRHTDEHLVSRAYLLRVSVCCHLSILGCLPAVSRLPHMSYVTITLVLWRLKRTRVFDAG